MKVKDLIGINPEAEITVVFADGTPYKGKLTYGWESEDAVEGTNTKSIASEVCIFLGDIDENISEV